MEGRRHLNGRHILATRQMVGRPLGVEMLRGSSPVAMLVEVLLHGSSPPVEMACGRNPGEMPQRGSSPLVEMPRGSSPLVEMPHGSSPMVEMPLGSSPRAETPHGTSPRAETLGTSPVEVMLGKLSVKV